MTNDPRRAQWLALLCERRELAFIAWMMSGYADMTEHARYLYWRHRVMAFQYSIRE